VSQYTKYLADRRLDELGFGPHYNVVNPAKWMAAANDTLQLVNFFESTNTSYESNAKASWYYLYADLLASVCWSA
jgi:ribonucleoside-diphosphate reductase beta chain